MEVEVDLERSWYSITHVVLVKGATKRLFLLFLRAEFLSRYITGDAADDGNTES